MQVYGAANRLPLRNTVWWQEPEPVSTQDALHDCLHAVADHLITAPFVPTSEFPSSHLRNPEPESALGSLNIHSSKLESQASFLAHSVERPEFPW